MVEDAVAKYVSLLSTIKVTDPKGNIQNMSIIDLIDAIGSFFDQEVNGAEFKPEPRLTMRIDKLVPRQFLDAIGAAMNQGAFVMLSDEDDLFDHGALNSARLRLSYLLCPLYHLPLTLGGAADVSRILSKQQPRAIRRALSQNDLFDGRHHGS
jgi:hypothetical protein